MLYKNNLYLKVFVCFLGVSFMFYGCKGEKLKLTCDYESTVEAGKDFYQPLITALEKYKAESNNYPSDVFVLSPKYIDKIPGVEASSDTPNSSDETGKLYSHQNIESQMITMRPDIESYYIKFYFHDGSNCLLKKNGSCTYTSSTNQWSCE